MNLPNFFLADLPPGTVLSQAMLQEACRTLRHNRDRYLAGRSTASMIHLLGSVGANWLQPEFPIRKLALEQGPEATGFSQATLRQGIDAFFNRFTSENFERLLEQDLGHPSRLDQFVATAPEGKTGRMAFANSPAFLMHITAGALPNPTWMSMVLGVLLRSAQFVKCATGASFLPRLFAHSLYEADPKLGACIELAEWPGGSSHLESVLFEEADCITATGSDETIAAIRGQLPLRARLVSYGQKLSFAFVSGEVLNGLNLLRVIENAATDVASWNQLGCLSPHVIYVEQGGATTPEQFAELLAKELDQRETSMPRGELPVQAAAGIASRRSIYHLRAANSPGTRCWCSHGSTAWTVIYEEDSRFQLSCLNRFIYIKPVVSLAEALQAADAFRKSISTVAVSVPEHKTRAAATELARWGATRICPLGQMQNPSLLWRHDGRLSLADLVTWSDWEIQG